MTTESNGLTLKHPTQEQATHQSKGAVIKSKQNMHRKNELEFSITTKRPLISTSSSKNKCLETAR